MKRYREYMNSVTVSDTLHEKLKRLTAPAGKQGAWKKYATAAAALALVIGIGAAGLGRQINGAAELGESITTEPAIEPTPMPDTPDMKTMGGYELKQGETVSYFLLPEIRYGLYEGEIFALDLALPNDVTRRDLTADELEGLFGGADHLRDHLDWEKYELSAYAMLWPDDSLYLLCISGSAGDTGLEHFALEIMPGEIPPTCCLYVDGELNHIWGQEITAESYDSRIGSTRRVSFLRGGYGYRFEITGADAEEIEVLASRLVRWIVVGDGLLLNQGLDVPADVPASADSDMHETPAEDPADTMTDVVTAQATTYSYDPAKSE